MENKALIIKGVTFEYLDGWQFNLCVRSLITPIYFRNKIKMLLITDAEKGEAFYVKTGGKVDSIFSFCETKIIRLPQGITYRLLENAFVQLLSETIYFYKHSK